MDANALASVEPETRMSKHWGQINHVIGARVLLTWGLGGGQSALGSGVFSKPGKRQEFQITVRAGLGLPAW